MFSISSNDNIFGILDFEINKIEKNAVRVSFKLEYYKGIPVLFQGSFGSTKRLMWRVFDIEFSITDYLF